jgi:hypothetical protein
VAEDLMEEETISRTRNAYFLGQVKELQFVIVGNVKKEDPVLESRQDVRFLGLYMYIAVLLSKLNLYYHCVYWRKYLNDSKKFFFNVCKAGNKTTPMGQGCQMV